MLTTKSILDELKGYNILSSSLKQDVKVNSVTIMLPNMNKFVDGIIYICKLSSFYTINPVEGKSTFFVIKDINDDTDLNRYNNVAIFGNETDLFKLFSDILMQIQITWRISEANVLVSQCIFEKNDITTMLQIVADLLGNPIFLQDSSTKLIANSDISDILLTNDEIIENILKHGFITADLFEKYNYKKLLGLIEQHPKSFVIESPCKEKARRIIARIKVKNRYLGWIVIPFIKKPFQEGDCEIMDILSNALSVVLENNDIISAATSHENLLLEMLTENFHLENEFKKRLSGFGWNLKDKYFILTISHKQQNIDSERNYYSIMMLAHKNQLRLLLPDVKCVFYENKLVMLFETEDSRKFETRIYSYLESNKLIGSLSIFFTNIQEIKLFYKQTSDILELGIKLHKKDVIFYHNNMYIYQMILELKKNVPLRSYCLTQLIDVLRYDQIYNTKYFSTIREYLNTRNISTTAIILNIHRNTMLYRIKKFTELTSLSLDSGGDIYNLWLSYKIMETFPEDFESMF